MKLSWLFPLTAIFTDEARHPRAAEEHREQDKKTFFHALQKEDAETMAAIAGKYPESFMSWHTEHGSPLQTAQAWGCFGSFVMLLGNGADTDEDYGGGWTPLLTALKDGNEIFYEYILGRRPDVDAVAHDGENRRVTALQLGIDRGDADAVRLLIEKGADVKLGIEQAGATFTPEAYALLKGETRIAEMLQLAPEIREIERSRINALIGRPAASRMPAAA
jgi:hypothetical protein